MPEIRAAWPNVRGWIFFSFTPRLGFQARHQVKIEPVGNRPVLVGPAALDVCLLPLQVAGIFDFRLELRGNFRIDRLEWRGEIGPRNIRPLKQMRPHDCPSRFVVSKSASVSAIADCFARNLRLRSGEARPTSAPISVSRRSALSCRRESRCSARGREHPVRLLGSLGHEIIDQHPDVGLIAAQDQRRPALDLSRGVDPGDKPLSGRFLITRRAVKLASKE